MKRLVLVHTVSPLIEVFNQLAKEMLPDVQVFHILDELLLEQERGHGTIDFSSAGEDGLSRLQAHIAAAEDVGASAVLVTCSTISPYIDRAAHAIPVLKIDEAMLEQAVGKGRWIVVMATNPKTLEPTRQAIQGKAAESGQQLDIQIRFIEDAFDALLGGDMQTHDRLVRSAIQQASAQADLLVLAQASMARVLEGMPEQSVPVLTSPHTALAKLQQIFVEP